MINIYYVCECRTGFRQEPARPLPQSLALLYDILGLALIKVYTYLGQRH